MVKSQYTVTMMTPRSRARNPNNRGYGNAASPMHQRGGDMRGANNPPTINVVDPSGSRAQHPGYDVYNENPNDYYGNNSGRAYSPQPRYGGHVNESRVTNSSLPTSPCTARKTRPLGASRGDETSTSTSQLPGGGGAGAFYWAAKVLNYF